ncbi:CRISPR-associated endonuclease Cas6 [uncultured Mucilaginibacter sp.]|uniref:CRISPR-associated endonuclease Cas6 n=1 Tax=uncultured Mucilaginibacter sp. TaxID=797541 RepID=UPI0025FB890E|nr:CRISPR-associated endonuclease Cas6 [uncultured Mucilaginibacter sp.]
MPHTIHTLSIIFNLRLNQNDLEAFRGAVIAVADKSNELFHNHNNQEDEGEANKFHYRYPLIHYRIQNHSASLFGINEGAVAIDKLLRSKAFKDFKINGRPVQLNLVERQENSSFALSLNAKKQQYTYRIYNYLPLTPDNYHQYKALPNFIQKVEFIEKLLANHLVAFAHGVNWEFPKNRRLEVCIQDIDRIKKTGVLGVQMMAFDLVFSSNALLPDRLGIGRKAAFGFGWIYRLE